MKRLDLLLQDNNVYEWIDGWINVWWLKKNVGQACGFLKENKKNENKKSLNEN